MSKALTIYQSTNEAWKIGILGFFLRVRGMLITATVAITTMGAPWWWPNNFKLDESSCFTPLRISIILFMAGVLLILTMIYLRKRSVRSLNIKMHLHNMAHELRDQQTKLYRKIKNNHLWDGDALSAFAGTLCDQIKPFFIELTYDETIEVAIRLAEEVKTESGSPKVLYKTYGRSSGLDKSRGSTSESILSTEGIPNILIESHDCKVVLKINDINEAAENGSFKKTKNENKFSHEIETMLIAPINAWDGSKESMIGILYVTSRKKKTLKPKLVDSIRFMADQIAVLFAFSAQEIKKNI